MASRYTILIEGRVSQTSPTLRKVLQDVKLGLNASVNGINELLLSIPPSTSAAIPACSVFFHMNASDVLTVTLNSTNASNNASQSSVLSVQRILNIASSFTGITITNPSTVNVVECRVIYS